MRWEKNFETGNALIDGQHKKLFQLAQQILDIDGFASRKEKVEKAINFLLNYALRHFETEEKIMLDSDYPEYASHKAIHADFIKEVIQFANRFNEEGDTDSISDTIDGFLLDWIKNHIMCCDKAMAQHYKNFDLVL